MACKARKLVFVSPTHHARTTIWRLKRDAMIGNERRVGPVLSIAVTVHGNNRSQFSITMPEAKRPGTTWQITKPAPPCHLWGLSGFLSSL